MLFNKKNKNTNIVDNDDNLSYSSISDHSNDYNRETIQSNDYYHNLPNQINNIEVEVNRLNDVRRNLSFYTNNTNNTNNNVFIPLTPPTTPPQSPQFLRFTNNLQNINNSISNNSEKRDTIQDVLDNQRNSNIPVLGQPEISIPIINISSSNNYLLKKQITNYTFFIEFINNILLLLLNFYVNKSISYYQLINVDNMANFNSTNLIIYQINNQFEFYNFLKYTFVCILYIFIKLLILYVMSDNIFYLNNEFFISTVSIFVDKKNKRYIFYFLLINILSTLLVIYILTLIYDINTIQNIYKPYIYNSTNEYYNISIGSFIYNLLITKIVFYNNVYDKRLLLSFIYGLIFYIFKYNGLNNIIITIYLNYYNHNNSCFIYLLILFITFIIAIFLNKYLYSKYIFKNI